MKITLKELRQLVKSVIKEQITTQQPMQPKLDWVSNKIVVENTDNGKNGEGFFDISAGSNVKNLINTYRTDNGTFTSKQAKPNPKTNYIYLSIMKIIQGENQGGIIDLRLNGKSIKQLPIDNGSGVPDKQYYVKYSLELIDLPKGNHLITMVTNKNQLNYMNFNACSLSFTVE
jgi:hypothetical protein